LSTNLFIETADNNW